VIRKILLGLTVVLLGITIVYISVRSFRMKKGMPDNVVIHPVATADFNGVDSILLKASDSYMAGAYRRFILGKNYREAWDAPVKIPVLWLDTLHGGSKPIKAGGGGQTRSLILEDIHGHKFALRSVCKDAVHSMPSFGKMLGLKNMVIDGISAGHPYAAVAVAKLCETAGILHNQPRLVYVPEQAVLDSFEQDFANRLYTLEYEQNGLNGDWTRLPNVVTTMESEMVQANLIENPLHHIDQYALLYARLFDVIINDWDRHPGNWGWAAQKEADGIKYTPFPVDRDMAFYSENGVAPWIFNRNGAMGKFRRHFRSKDYLKAALHKSRFIDPCYLNEMTRSDFLKAANMLQQKMTDNELRKAFEVWPDTVYRLNAPAIINKIKIRRNKLPEYAEAFYEHLAETPQIMGTNGVDSFSVHQENEQQMMVEMFSKDESGNYFKKYKRSFFKSETKEINVFALDGDDLLFVENNISIPIIFQAGKGMDKLEIGKEAKNAKKMIRLTDDANGIIAPKNIKTKKKGIELMIPRA
jgi:hypothetical protein